jgi:hypothetical protein
MASEGGAVQRRAPLLTGSPRVLHLGNESSKRQVLAMSAFGDAGLFLRCLPNTIRSLGTRPRTGRRIGLGPGGCVMGVDASKP